jgi:hypothetical protein
MEGSSTTSGRTAGIDRTAHNTCTPSTYGAKRDKRRENRSGTEQPATARTRSVAGGLEAIAVGGAPRLGHSRHLGITA